MDEVERWNRRHSPAIPESEAVGCDVCPAICQWRDLSVVPPDELFRGYRELAARWADGPDRYDWHLGRDLGRVACIAKRHPDPAVKERFLGYLWDGLDTIRYATAMQALVRGFGQERAMESLRDLSRGNTFELGRRAWALHRYWRDRLGITLRDKRARQRATHEPGAHGRQ